MEISVMQSYYEEFKKSVKLRLTDNCAIPLSGGLDSTLIVKSINDMNLIKSCTFICMNPDSYAREVAKKYNLNVHYFYPNIEDFESYLHEIVSIWEEPFYSISVGYFLYKEINKLGLRVSLSGLGSDELYGGYSYYNTIKYPRGLFKEIVAINNEEKLSNDKNLLINHHLRKNDKMGLEFNVEGRYPFLDKNLMKFNENCFNKKIIKEILLNDFDEPFINRKKTGFSMDWVDNDIIEKNVKELFNKIGYINIENKRQRMFYAQLNIWLKIFNNDNELNCDSFFNI